MNDSSRGTILVTGGSGYVGGWTVAELLHRGYAVRTTVRRLAQADAARAAIVRSGAPSDRLSIVVADLLQDDGWARAVDDIDAVLHVASPMPVREYRKTDLVAPARDGTLRVLRAAASAGVRRVVMMSSVQAALPDPDAPDEPSDATTWTNLDLHPKNDYMRAKTIAERAAWEFIRDVPTLELTTVLPGSVQGPVLQAQVSGSVELVQRLLRGAVPAIPRIGFAIVDVRDLAEVQLRAMLAPEAAGKRIIASGDFLWMREIAALLRAELGPGASRVPTRLLPDFVVRAAALVDFEARFLAPNLGKRGIYSATLARRVLGVHFRPARETILDSARSLIALGAA